jgi:two-component system, cell cycle sensor histidine kinase and response regulator CckA
MGRERDKAPDAAILQQIFRDAPLPIAIYDLTGELSHSNDAHDAFTAALGDAAGIGDFNALYDLRSERGGHRGPFQRALGGAVSDYAFSVRPQPALESAEFGPRAEERASTQAREDADTLHFHRLLMPAYDAQQKIVGVISVLIDVSDWLRAQLDTARLQAQLQEAQKTEGLGLLAGSIAHDFNNLLVGVLGNVSLLLESLAESSPLRRIALAIELAAQRAADVARQLLAYAGKGQFRVEELNISDLVGEIGELLRITIGQGRELCMELAPGISTVRVDATQMRQVVMNLITNARDAVGQGGRITLRTGELPQSRVDFAACLGKLDRDAHSFVFLEVEDTGPGMDVATAARIFDPFFTTKSSGHGLGLSAVLGIVRSHAGAMSVRSAPGRGTTMRVLLPALGKPAEKPKLVLAAQARAPGHTGHVLVVDDQDMVRVLVTQMLRKLGYSVTGVASADEALRTLEREAATTSGVLLDLTMPGEDGGQTFVRIRERYPGLPIIFMSGYEPQSVPDANGFLHKPFTLDQLRRTLSEVLSPTGQSAPPDASR